MNDPALVDIGLYADKAEAKEVRNAMYDAYMADFMRWISKQRSFREMHTRGHWLFVNYLLKKGVIDFKNRDGSAQWTPDNVVPDVVDYDKFQDGARELLGVLQTIKATRDEAGLAKIFADYAPLDAIKEPWADAAIRRGENLSINSGTVEQPWRVDSKLNFTTLGDLTLEGIARVSKKP